MTRTIAVRDSAPGGAVTTGHALSFEQHEVTVRELIECRVREEVAEYAARRDSLFRGLVAPEGSHPAPGGVHVPEGRVIDEAAQISRALRAFETNGFVVLVDGRQLESLDDRIQLGDVEEAVFIRLMPLVGG